jgi:zinc protease
MPCLFRAPCLLVLAMMLIANPVSADDKVSEFMLDNGMKVIVLEDHRAPVVVSQVWYRVGSSDEYEGVTGISHLLEHMMFKGTNRLEPGEFSRIVASLGGEENAFTSRDYTAYFQTLASDRLERVIELEADRMVNLQLVDDEFERERAVVIEERRLRTEDRPTSLFWERLLASAWLANPYRRPVIGWMDDLESLTIDDLRNWYRRWYSPSNAILVVAGAVEPAEVERLARRHFGPIEGGKRPLRRATAEPHPLGSQRLELAVEGANPYLALAYRVPTAGTSSDDQAWQPYALEVLAWILDGGTSARLARDLVRGSEVAASAGASYSPHARLEDLFVLYAIPGRERTLTELEEALRKQVEQLQQQEIDAAELERVKAQVVAEDLFERDSLYYQAQQLGSLEANGLGWQRGNEYVKRIESVTARQVLEVARRYLVDRRLTTATLRANEG